jgi:hypothetical protein
MSFDFTSYASFEAHFCVSSWTSSTGIWKEFSEAAKFRNNLHEIYGSYDSGLNRIIYSFLNSLIYGAHLQLVCHDVHLIEPGFILGFFPKFLPFPLFS